MNIFAWAQAGALKSNYDDRTSNLIARISFHGKIKEFSFEILYGTTVESETISKVLAGGLFTGNHYAVVMHKQHKNIAETFSAFVNVAKIFIFFSYIFFFVQSIKRYFSVARWRIEADKRDRNNCLILTRSLCRDGDFWNNMCIHMPRSLKSRVVVENRESRMK